MKVVLQFEDHTAKETMLLPQDKLMLWAPKDQPHIESFFSYGVLLFNTCFIMIVVFDCLYKGMYLLYEMYTTTINLS